MKENQKQTKDSARDLAPARKLNPVPSSARRRSPSAREPNFDASLTRLRIAGSHLVSCVRKIEALASIWMAADLQVLSWRFRPGMIVRLVRSRIVAYGAPTA